MKREIKIHRFSGKPDTATIIIDKSGLRVDNKSYPNSDTRYCTDFIGQLLDMDSWKFTWHMVVDNVRYKGSEERKFAREKLNEKIKQREEEIQMLKDGLQILSRLNINTK